MAFYAHCPDEFRDIDVFYITVLIWSNILMLIVYIRVKL